MGRLITLGIVAALLLVNTVATNRETKPATEARGGHIVELDGGDLFYKDQGDRGDPVMVLLHGFAGSERWWDRVTPDLVRRGFRVIRFDLLGHGRSEKPRDGYGMDEQASRVAAALAKLHVRRATVVGHSMGGTVASALLREKPALVRRIAVLDTPPRDGFADLPLTGRIATWPVIGQLARRFAPDQVIRAGLDSAFADRVDVPDAFVDDLDGMTYSSYDKSSSESHDYLEDHPNGETVKRAHVPLLVIFGTADDIVEPRAADTWADDVPSAKVVKLRGVGHSPHWERARDVAALLAHFGGR
jgi:pimeloyl-ACP methyl ester carboxylesterase